MYKKYFSIALMVLLSQCIYSQHKNAYKVSKTFHIKTNGWWDYIAVNNGKLYVSHGMNVNIINEETGDSVSVIPNTPGVHGIAFCNELNRGYTSNGRSNNVSVFDLQTNKVITQIATGENPDAIFFEPFSNKIITCNGRSKSLSMIDPATNSVAATINVGGKPEEAASDGKGKLFVNIEDKNEVAVVDLSTLSVTDHWSLAPGKGPTGLAFDEKTNRLFSGCEKLLVVLDAATGKTITNIPIGEGCDGVVLDTTSHSIFTSNGEGNITAVNIKSSEEFFIKETISTKPGARTIAINQQTHKLYLPTAEFEPLNDSAQKGTRPKMLPGSFQVLVVQ